MPKSNIQLRWTHDQNGWTGLIMPVFSIFKEKKGWTLDILSKTRNPEHAHRFVKVDSLHQGKCIARALLKEML